MYPSLQASLWGLLLGLIAIPWASAKAPYELSLSQLEARYADAASQFVTLDGVRVHYKDEGSGPALVMVHASFLNLHAWDALAERLSRSHRVVRLDMLMAGLTGNEPSGNYSMERNLELLELLLGHLKIDSYSLVGTSSGAIVAFRHAAAHADKVQRLILINAAGMPRTAATDPNRARGSALSQWIRARYQSKGYWRDSLVGQFTGGTVPPETLIQRTYDMNRREDGKTYAKKFMRNFRTGDPEAELAKVRAPTLIAWGMGNITVSHLEANVFQLWLTGAPSMLIKYPKLGHYAYIEEPDLIAKDFEDFLLGRRDDELRITQRANLNEVSDH
jgi:pimeloyl-ACP methyl ester carboxylesterase